MIKNVKVRMYETEVPCVMLITSDPDGTDYCIYENKELPLSPGEEWSKALQDAYRIIVMASRTHGVELPMIDPDSGQTIDLNRLIYPPSALEEE